MYCPNCRYEYEDWATTCSDCEVALEPGTPPLPESPQTFDYGQFRDWVILTNVPNVMMGNLLKDQIEQAGIPVLMKRSRATDIAEFSHNDFVMHDLYVPLRFAMRARRLVDSPPTHGPRGEAWTDEWLDADDEDEAVEDLIAEPQQMGRPGPATSGWYLMDSPRPAPTLPVPQTEGLSPETPPLPGLGHYQEMLGRRKSHQAAGPAPERRVVPFPTTMPPRVPLHEVEEDADDGPMNGRGATDWSRSRIYRVLMGLLFLAWTLPFLLQMLGNFRDAWARLFP